MKYIILFLVLCSCGIPGDGDTVVDPPTITIEGCEYVQVRPQMDRSFTHKGNCKNPIHKCQ